MTLDTVIVSSIPGRLRLRHPLLRRAQQSNEVAARLRSIVGVLSVEANPATGSLLLHYDSARCDRSSMETQVAATARFDDAAPFGMLPPQSETRPQPQAPSPSRKRGPGRELNRLAKVGMVVSFPVSLAFAAAGGKRLHALAGGVFTLLLLIHLAVHRHHLLR